jgi:hypothetical protein
LIFWLLLYQDKSNPPEAKRTLFNKRYIFIKETRRQAFLFPKGSLRGCQVENPAQTDHAFCYFLASQKVGIKDFFHEFPRINTNYTNSFLRLKIKGQRPKVKEKRQKIKD